MQIEHFDLLEQSKTDDGRMDAIVKKEPFEIHIAY
jgi:hypothetical protein